MYALPRVAYFYKKGTRNMKMVQMAKHIKNRASPDVYIYIKTQRHHEVNFSPLARPFCRS